MLNTNMFMKLKHIAFFENNCDILKEFVKFLICRLLRTSAQRVLSQTHHGKFNLHHTQQERDKISGVSDLKKQLLTAKHKSNFPKKAPTCFCLMFPSFKCHRYLFLAHYAAQKILFAVADIKHPILFFLVLNIFL